MNNPSTTDYNLGFPWYYVNNVTEWLVQQRVFGEQQAEYDKSDNISGSPNFFDFSLVNIGAARHSRLRCSGLGGLV